MIVWERVTNKMNIFDKNGVEFHGANFTLTGCMDGQCKNKISLGKHSHSQFKMNNCEIDIVALYLIHAELFSVSLLLECAETIHSDWTRADPSGKIRWKKKIVLWQYRHKEFNRSQIWTRSSDWTISIPFQCRQWRDIVELIHGTGN